MEKKNLIQTKAVQMAQDNNLLLSWATGTGKSYAAIKIALNYTNKKWYVICKETTHIENWKKEFEKHKIDFSNFIFFCYDSLHKYINTEANLILDEVHCITELRLSYLKQIKSDKIIALSATVPDDKKELLTNLTKYCEYHISLSDAIDDGIIPSPKVYILDIFLETQEPTEIYILKKGLQTKRVIIECNFKDRYKVFKEHKDVELHIRCTEKEKYELLNNEFEYYKKQHFKIKQKWSEFKWLQSGLKRKNFISSIKTKYAEKLLTFLEGKRLICFTGSIEQCIKLGKSYSIHSKSGDSENLDLINKFNNLSIDKLFAVKMLREGINLEKINSSIIIQLDNQLLSFIQMLGRSIRGDFPECFILVVRNTQDEVYLNTALTGFNKNYLYKFDKNLLLK